MSVANGAVIQITSQYAFPYSSAIQNVWHMRVTAAMPAAEALVEVACELFLENVFNNLEVLISSQVGDLTFAVDEMQWNAGAGRWDILRRIAEDIVGGFVPVNAGNPLPAGVAACIEFLPVYRRNRGYKYFGGLTEEGNNPDGMPDSVLTAALANTAIDVLAEYTIETGVSTMNYVILNRTYGVMNDPSAAIVKGQWAYQRRRKYGKGL